MEMRVKGPALEGWRNKHATARARILRLEHKRRQLAQTYLRLAAEREVARAADLSDQIVSVADLWRSVSAAGVAAVAGGDYVRKIFERRLRGEGVEDAADKDRPNGMPGNEKIATDLWARLDVSWPVGGLSNSLAAERTGRYARQVVAPGDWRRGRFGRRGQGSCEVYALLEAWCQSLKDCDGKNKRCAQILLQMRRIRVRLAIVQDALQSAWAEFEEAKQALDFAETGVYLEKG